MKDSDLIKSSPLIYLFIAIIAVSFITAAILENNHIAAQKQKTIDRMVQDSIEISNKLQDAEIVIEEQNKILNKCDTLSL